MGKPRLGRPLRAIRDGRCRRRPRRHRVVRRERRAVLHLQRKQYPGKELFYALQAVAPMTAPDPNDPNSEGEAWGVLGSFGLAYNAGNGWVYNTGGTNTIRDVVAVSTSVGYAWLLKEDGSVWATKTGYSGERVGSGFTAKSICGGQGDYCFAVGTDGKPYRTTDPNPLA